MTICRYFLLCMLLAISAHAQLPKDTLRIKEVQIQSQREIQQLQKVQTIDSFTLVNNNQQNLAELLDYNSTASFRNYGVGGSSVVSIRGTNSSQTKVFWNGLPVNSPMLGQLDFALIPVSFVKKVSLQYGGSSADNGSGAIGGTVFLESGADHNNRFSISLHQQIASFHHYGTNLSVGFGNDKWQSLTSFNTISAKNDFEYTNRTVFGHPTQIMNNAETIQYGIMQELFLSTSRKIGISLHSWYQWSDNNIAPPMYSRNSIAKQKDWNWRNVLKVNTVFNDRFSLEATAGYIRQFIHFQNRMKSGEVIFTLLDTESSSDFFDQKSTLNYHLNKKINLSGGYEWIYEGAIVEDYNEYRQRQRLALFASVNYRIFRTLDLSASARKEFVQNLEPYAVSFAASQLIIHKPELRIKANISRNYNLPTLNDLYWVPGGNKDLQPEEGWHKEASIINIWNVGRVQFNTDITAYYAIINDWILWQPSAIENGIWAPQNLRKVRTQGYELSESVKINSGRLSWTLTGLYSYSEATNLQGVTENDQSIGKQLIYVPFEMFKFSSWISYRHISLNYLVNRVGFRYTTSDNKEFLPSYTVQQASLGYFFTLRNCTLGAAFKVDNIFDVAYESLPYKPLPGRNYSVNINLKFNTKSK